MKSFTHHRTASLPWNVCLVLLVIGVFGGSAHAIDWDLIHLEGGGATHLDIDGYRVVWTYGGSVRVYDHLSGQIFHIPDSWGARDWLVEISGDRVAWIRHTESRLMVYDLSKGEITHSIEVDSSSLYGFSGENALIYHEGDLYLMNIRTRQHPRIGKGGATPTGHAPNADIDGDNVVYVLEGDPCGGNTPEVYLWNAISGTTSQISDNFDRYYGPDCKPLAGRTPMYSRYPRISGDTVVWSTLVYPPPPSGGGYKQCMIWQGGAPRVFPFLDNPTAYLCDVPDVSSGRVTWLEVDTSLQDTGRRLFHDMSTGETKVVPTTEWFFALGYLSGSNLGLIGSVMMAVSDDNDQDQDGLLDTWEIAGGVDWDEDGQIDLPLPGANPRHRDLYVEVDAMIGRRPSDAALQAVKNAFRRAPVSNPDGTNGINLHIEKDWTDPVTWADDWPLLQGENMPAGFVQAEEQHFGTKMQRQDTTYWETVLKPAKRAVYRHCIFANSYKGGKATGRADRIPGANFFVALGTVTPVGGSTDQQAAQFMHELGHTLGLSHSGKKDEGNEFNFKPNYFSVMNYAWSMPVDSYADSWVLDYSRIALPTLDEGSLSELAGIQGPSPIRQVPVGPPLVPEPCVQVPGQKYRLVDQFGPVDWDCSGTIDASPVTICGALQVCDINNLFAVGESWSNFSPHQKLEGWDDWSNLTYPPVRTVVPTSIENIRSPSETPSMDEENWDFVQGMGGPGTSTASRVIAPATIEEGSGDVFQDTFAGIALANPNNYESTLRVKALTSDGQEKAIKQEMGTVPSQGQKANTASELLENPSEASCLMAEGSPPEVKGFFMAGNYDLRRLDGVGGFIRASDELYFPLIQQTETDRTYLFLFNPSLSTDQVAWLRLFDEDGEFQAEKEVQFAGLGTLEGTLDEIFEETIDVDEGYIEVKAQTQLRGFEFLGGTEAYHALTAQPVEGTDRLVAPHFYAARNGGSILRLLNVGDRDVSAVLKGYSDSGEEMGTAEITINSRKLYNGSLAELIGIDTSNLGTTENIVGYLTIEMTDGTHHLPKVIGSLTFHGNDGEWVSTLPLLNQGRNRTLFLHVAHSDELAMFTGVAILNDGDSEATVSVEIYDEDGEQSGQKELKIAAGCRIVDILSGTRLFGSGFEQAKGHIKLLSDLPVMSFALFGGNDLRFMSAIEGQE
jgi:hypothetical protein